MGTVYKQDVIDALVGAIISMGKNNFPLASTNIDRASELLKEWLKQRPEKRKVEQQRRARKTDGIEV